MRSLVIFLSILVGFLLGAIYSQYQSNDANENSTTNQGGNEQKKSYSQLQNTVSFQRDQITILEREISVLKSKLEGFSTAEKTPQFKGSIPATESNTSPADEDELLNKRRFQTVLSSFENEVTDTEWSLKSELSIEDAFAGEANKNSIYYSNMECRSSSCYLELDNMNFSEDFESILFQIIEDKKLSFHDAVITPDPLTQESSTANYQIIFVSETGMN